MATANELIMIFIGLEISSIASYVLAGYLRDDKRNNESALKYFLLGSFATAFFLYGVAWIYGLTGSTNLTEIRRVVTTREIAPSMALVGTAAGPDVRRLRLQGIGGAVPDLGSGRLPGRACAGHRLHVHRSQGRRLRHVPARLHDCLRADRRQLGAARLECRRCCR